MSDPKQSNGHNWAELQLVPANEPITENANEADSNYIEKNNNQVQEPVYVAEDLPRLSQLKWVSPTYYQKQPVKVNNRFKWLAPHLRKSQHHQRVNKKQKNPHTVPPVVVDLAHDTSSSPDSANEKETPATVISVADQPGPSSCIKITDGTTSSSGPPLAYKEDTAKGELNLKKNKFSMKKMLQTNGSLTYVPEAVIFDD